MMPDNAETYIGDGLYCSYDGYQFKLRAPRDEGDHIVYLDGHVLRSFFAFAAEHGFRPDLQRPGPDNEDSPS